MSSQQQLPQQQQRPNQQIPPNVQNKPNFNNNLPNQPKTPNNMNNNNNFGINKNQQQLGQTASPAAAALLAKQSGLGGAFASPNNNALSPHQRSANNQSPLNAIGNNMTTPTNKSKSIMIYIYAIK
jgi:hypothetical protein